MEGPMMMPVGIDFRLDPPVRTPSYGVAPRRRAPSRPRLRTRAASRLHRLADRLEPGRPAPRSPAAC